MISNKRERKNTISIYMNAEELLHLDTLADTFRMTRSALLRTGVELISLALDNKADMKTTIKLIEENKTVKQPDKYLYK